MAKRNSNTPVYPMYDVGSFPLPENLHRTILESTVGVHLAIMQQPWYGWLMDGSKSIESRFSLNRCAPYEKVHPGDIVLVKNGLVSAAFTVATVHDIDLTKHPISDLEEQYSSGIHADRTFWTEHSAKRFCTLVWVGHCIQFPGFPIDKRDRRGWVVLRDAVLPEIL